MKKTIALLCLCVLLAGVLPAFAQVIEYKTNATKMNPVNEKYYVSETEYKDPSLHVIITEGREYETDYLVIRIRCQNGTQIRSAMESKDGKATGSCITIAKKANAVVAMNGDFFRENKKEFGKFVVRQGRKLENNSKGDMDILLIDSEGNFHLLQKPKKSEINNYIEENKLDIVNSYSFGPILILNGEVQQIKTDRGIDSDGAAQRSAICQCEVTDPEYQLEYLCVVSAGPDNPGSKGMSVPEFTEIISRQEGVKQAYNLDGGSSAAVVFRGKKINAFGLQKNRYITDMLCFGSAWVD